jgi:dihydropteroate synthase
MGVVNATPDSFSDGGRFLDPQHAIDHALSLIEEGAAIVDIGGESTRPGADDVPQAEELARVLPIVKGLAAQSAAPISIDTRKPYVARACIDAGAAIWNDVSALRYAPDSPAEAARSGARIVLMHAQGAPKSMQDAPLYGDVVAEVETFLKARIAAAAEAGVAPDKVIVDPGVGFGKTLAHNVALLAATPRLAAIGSPLLIGASRKRFIAALDRDGPAADRQGGSIAAALAAAAGGAAILRVHDVAATRQALAVAAALKSA